MLLIQFVVNLIMYMQKFTNDTKYLMLALDQRGSFETLLATSDRQILLDKKRQIIEALTDMFTGVLIDPDYGLSGYKASNSTKPYILCSEKTGYENRNGERLTEVQYTVTELKKMGASGVKLLVYFNPFLESASKQLETAQSVLRDCQEFNLPLFFEIVTYGDQNDKNLVIESVKYFLSNEFRPDVFKLEYPGSAQACQQVSQLVGETDWIMLTAGADFNEFSTNLETACANGCSGFLAGRSIWQDMVVKDIGQEERNTMRERFAKIVAIAEKK